MLAFVTRLDLSMLKWIYFIENDETMNRTVKESTGTLLYVVYKLLIHERSYFCFGSRVYGNINILGNDF